MPRFLLVALLLLSSAANAQLLVKDDAGRSLIVRQHFKRIVTLAPFLTEAAFAAGAGDLVVGVDALSDYPAEVQRLPKVPTGAAFSLEALAELKPDLVLAWKDGIRTADVETLTGFGATVYLGQARSLEDVSRLLTNIGALSGRNPHEALSRYETRLKDLRKANVNKPKLSVFVEIWNRPLTTVGGNSLLTEAVEVCRGDNVFADLPGSLPRVEWDEVAEANPYVILGVNSANNAQEFQANWTSHYNLAAVQAGRVLYIESETLQRPSLRTLDSIAHLCADLDQVRLQNSLIAPSEAFEMPQGPVAASAEAAPEVLRRPMTRIERDVAAVLASSYAVGKAAPEAASATDASPREAVAAPASAPRPAAPSPPPTLAAAAPVANPGLRAARSLENVASPGDALARYTQVKRHGDLYFVSGQIGLDPDTGNFDAAREAGEQTRAALENVRRVLEGERLTMANVVSTTIYLRDINDMAAMEQAYESAFRRQLPSRSVVEMKNLPRGARVQIAVVAGR